MNRRSAFRLNLRSRHPLAWLVAAAAIAAPASSWADVGRDPAKDAFRDQCIVSNTQAQSLRREGKLAAARRELAICGDARCPALVRDDCSQQLYDLERAQPTIVFDAKDSAGADVAAVKVSLDGKPLADALDGTALAVDPGDHVFTFEAPGDPPVTRELILKEGEKGRRERVVVRTIAPPQVAIAVTATPSSPVTTPATGLGGQRIAGLVVGGAGVVGLGVGALFGAMASSSWSSSKSECSSPTSCPDHSKSVTDHDSAVSQSTVATVGFVAGAALVAAGIVLFTTGPSRSAGHEGGTAGRIDVTPSVGRDGAGLVVTGTL